MAHNLYLIVSDLHTTEIEDNEDGWKRYKSSKFGIDGEFEKLVRHFSARGNGENKLTLILNGDIIDFDLVTSIPEQPPWPVSRSEHSCGLNPTSPKSEWKLHRVLDHHPKFVQTLARFLSEGHEIVYVLGNHDQEFQFQPVQDILNAAIKRSADEQGLTLGEEAHVRFEPWFFHVPNEIYAEHGQQYDAYSSFRYMLTPHVDGADGIDELAIPMGNLSCRELINRLGFFNPHSSAGFILSLFAYLSHWFHHYAFTRRSLIFSWLWGSLCVWRKTLAIRAKVLTKGPKDHEAKRNHLAERVALSSEVVEAIDNERSLPIADKVFRVLRELWLDRLFLLLVLITATVLLTLTSAPLWVKLMVPLSTFPLVFLIYEAVAAVSAWEWMAKLPQRARRIAEMVGCPVITFGHTHLPMTLPLARGVTLVNTGTWSPTWGEGEILTPGIQNYAVVEVNQGAVDVEIGSWLEADGKPIPAEPLREEPRIAA